MTLDNLLTPDALQALSAFIFDLDGVIWSGNAPIAGAAESVSRLKAGGRRCLFATNNSSRTQEDFAQRLRGFGIEAEADDVMTSSTATALYLSHQYKDGFSAYVIGCEGILTALANVGAQVHTGDEATVSEVDCVVVGIDWYFTYAKMRTALRLLLNGARFIATNGDPTYPTETGLIPGAGSLVASVATASGMQPVVIGKPEPLMLQLCQQKLDLPADRLAMVGDRLDTDVACAHRAGIHGVLVGTGVTSLADGERATGEQKPDAMFADLPALCAAVLA